MMTVDDRYVLSRMMTQLRKALEKPENRAEFEEWHLKKYGRKYEWKKEEEEI